MSKEASETRTWRTSILSESCLCSPGPIHFTNTSTCESICLMSALSRDQILKVRNSVFFTLPVVVIVVVQSPSHVWLSVPLGLQLTRLPGASLPPWVCSDPSFLRSMSIESVMPSNHLILSHPLLLLALIFPRIRVFSDESVLHIRWTKYWSFSSSISPSNEYSVFISFRINWFDLLAIQGTLKSLLQNHSRSNLLCFAHNRPSKSICWMNEPFLIVNTFLKFKVP